jgi:hypothetical protein
MSASIKAGDMVKWKWGGGEVVKRYTRKITLTLKGSEVTREASEDAPALRIEQADGDVVLKSASEVDKV